MKKLALVVAVLALAFGGFVVYARMGKLDSSAEEAMARYGAAPSKFITIDGTRLHYRDEGSGPAIVMLHGSRANLQQWDGWVKELGGRYRTVRLDDQAHGLTGFDGKGDYSAARYQFLLSSLIDELKLEKFVLVGTSGGSTSAIRYAAAHPDRVEKLVLSTVPLRLPTQANTKPWNAFVFWFHEKVLHSLGTDWYWRTFLRSIYADPDKVTDDIVTRYRILNTQPGREPEFRNRIKLWRASGGADRDFETAGKITMPVLIQWGLKGPVLPKELHCQIASAFTATQVRVISYPDLGHKLVMEDPVRTARDALQFIEQGTGGEVCAPQ